MRGDHQLYGARARASDDHAKFLAHELTLQGSSDSSKCVILTGEVGLGKTIEAGLLISQKWAERKCSDAADDISARLDAVSADAERPILDALSARNGGWFDAEMEKLARWAEDRRHTLKAELSDLDERMKEMRRAARSAPSLPEKLERQREL